MDADAVRFLKIFSFLSLDEIEDIRKQFEAAPHERLAQKVLAREVVTLVHGEEAYKEALNITEQLFAGNIKNLSVKELKQGLRGCSKLPSTSRRKPQYRRTSRIFRCG